MRLKYSSVALAAGVCAGIALACGVDFRQVLSARRASLLQPVVGDFFFSAARLAPKPKNKYASAPAGDTAADAATAESAGLSEADARRIKEMRASADGDAAYARGKGLPEGVRLYVAGAVDFQKAKASLCASSTTSNVFSCSVEKEELEPVQKDFRRAIRRFEAVLALPAGERRARATWAAYSLGRAYLLSGIEGAAAQAEKYFELTRTLADEGNPDPLHLAAASLGEQARIHFNAGDLARAAGLYAEQAALEAPGAVASLSLVARRLFDDPALLRKQISSPIVQRLLIAYLEAYGEDGNEGYEGLATNPNIADSAAAERPAKRTSHFKLLVGALEEAGVGNPPDADRLAAIAYVAGDFERAKKFAATADSVQALWIRAKLAVRDGDGKAAARLFSQAIKKASAADESGMAADALPRLRAENSVLTLAHGDYRLAFEQLYAAANLYWMDVAYLAERVLTTDELKQFVDARVPQPPLPKVAGEGNNQYALPDEGAEWPASNPAAQLRELLARRLMREGRYEEAFPYFHASADKRFGDTDARQAAKDFAARLKAADSAWTAIGKAAALYEAASIARWKGMEVFGYELAPDYSVVNGALELSSPEPRRKDFAGDEEIAHYQATQAPVDKRFHYRYRAVELAIRASELLPKRSEAYAAVLCNATSWLIHRDPPEAAKIYRRYVKNGALVEWGESFGESCPEPGFQGARLFGAKQELRRFQTWARHHKAPVLAAAVVFAAILLGSAVWLSRRWRSG